MSWTNPARFRTASAASFFIEDPLAPATCAEYNAQTAGTTPPPANFGSIVVTDAQPFPTSKEQCRNGGWRNFPGFKNQGACVSFVATGGRNRPPGSYGSNLAEDRRAANAIARHSQRGWRIDKPGKEVHVDAIIALAMALDSAESEPEPVRLLG